MRRSRRRNTLLVLLAVTLAASGVPAPAAAQGPPPKVGAADPPSAEQGTLNLDVTISGRNFDDSAVARFFVSGTENPGGVLVKSTRFVNSGKLVANIDVADAAEVGAFDIEIELRRSGRKGKGTERFAVFQKGGGGNEEILLDVTFRNAVGDLVRSDLLAIPTYSHGEDSKIVVRIGNTFGKFNLFTSKSQREVTLDTDECGRLFDGSCLTDASLGTINEWADIGVGLDPTGEPLDLRSMEVGETAFVDFYIAIPSKSKSTPHLYVFGSSNRYQCGDPLPVTRVDANNWWIEASTESACLVEVVSRNTREITRRDFPLPFGITLTRQ